MIVGKRTRVICRNKCIITRKLKDVNYTNNNHKKNWVNIMSLFKKIDNVFFIQCI